ncbi:unnamed protein product, partial [Brenthis ino]
MPKFFMAFLVFYVAGLSALNSVNADCTPGPDCSDCSCNASLTCCEGYFCAESSSGSGVCRKTQDLPYVNPSLIGG